MGKIKIFLVLLIASFFVGNAAFAECESGSSCFQACPSGYSPGGGSCIIDIPGIEFTPGVCCKSNPTAPIPSASNTGASATSSPSADNTSSGLVPCDTNCTLCHLVVGFKRIFDFFIATLFIATMMAITVSGVFYMVSTGNKKVIEMAKTALTYSLMAFVIGMGSWIIINTIMVGLGFKHPYGGNWWEFTCDTTPSQGPTGSGTSPNWGGGLAGKGCDGVAQNALAMNGWSYTQDSAGRMANGSADCSSMVSRSYAAAGCSSPGGDTSAMYGNAVSVNDQSSLRAGDSIVYRNGNTGHVVMCLDSGCNTVMSANSANGIYSRSYNNDLNKYNAKVIRASDYCPGC